MRILSIKWWKQNRADTIFNRQEEISLLCKWDVGQCCIWYVLLKLPTKWWPELSCNHKKADTRMLLHAKQITDTNMRNIIISTPYTDVFLIGTVALTQINASLFIRTGTKNNAWIISISKMKEALQLKYVPKSALLGLRQFWRTESRLKMMKNAFYFTSKALFVHKIFQFLSGLFGHVQNRLD